MLCVAICGCLSLHTRLYATVAISASPEALYLSKGAMRWQAGNGQMPHLIYPQRPGTRPEIVEIHDDDGLMFGRLEKGDEYGVVHKD